MIHHLALACLISASIPAVLLLANLPFFRKPRKATAANAPGVSVCIPVRNEAANIEATLTCVLANGDAVAEILIGDDGSEDATRAIVEQIATEHPKIRFVSIPSLPVGWSGKQHNLSHLASQASSDLLLFIDADVHIGADAIQRMVAMQAQRNVDLLSGFPRQQTVTLGEALLIPHIQFILLGFLPFGFARLFNHPAFAAGCGQLFLARKSAYEQAGGHSGIRESVHDGIHLPRLFRRHKLRTDFCDASKLAQCRMYGSLGESWDGLGKNATDGIGAPGTILPFTFMLSLGQVLPLPVLLWALLTDATQAAVYAGIALGLSSSVHHYLALRLRQSVRCALLHPLGIALLLAIQWTALYRKITGKPASWKGRAIRPT